MPGRGNEADLPELMIVSGEILQRCWTEGTGGAPLGLVQTSYSF